MFVNGWLTTLLRSPIVGLVESSCALIFLVKKGLKSNSSTTNSLVDSVAQLVFVFYFIFWLHVLLSYFRQEHQLHLQQLLSQFLLKTLRSNNLVELFHFH